MTMDFHDQFEDVFDIKNGDFLVSILVFREGTIRKICQLCTFQMTTRLSWSSWTIPKKLLEIATVVNLNIKEISVSLKHFRLQLFWNQHDDEKQQETASIEWCCWFHLKLGVGIYMLPISCKYEILLSKLIKISGYLLVSRKGGDIWWIICVVASFLKCINLVPQRTPSFFSKLFEASPGLWKKRSTGRGEKRPADWKKHGRGHGGFRDWYQEGELDSQACGGLDLSASNRCWGFETTVVRNGDRPKPWEYFVVRDLSSSLGKLVSSRCWGYRAHMILQGIQDIWLEEMPATVDCHLL